MKRFDFVWSLFVSRVCRKWSHLAGFTLNPMSFLSFPRKTSQRTPRSWQTTRPGTARKRSSLHAGIKVLSELILNKGFLSLRKSQNRYSSISLEIANLVLDIYFDHDPSHTLHFEPPFKWTSLLNRHSLVLTLFSYWRFHYIIKSLLDQLKLFIVA